jgi:Mg2+/Co2+ transporter CorB
MYHYGEVISLCSMEDLLEPAVRCIRWTVKKQKKEVQNYKQSLL